MIVLDHAQSLALRRAATKSIRVRGAAGTGKTVLANAVAVQSAQAGLTCLLIGLNPELDRPLVYRAASARHPILSRRAQVSRWSTIDRHEIDPLEARARLDPAAMQLAARTLRYARELLAKHRLDPDEVENSLVATQSVAPEALDLLTVVVHDATKIADMLWSGNRRSGRSLGDVAGVIARKIADVPPDEEPLDLLLDSDSNFEQRVATLLTTVQRTEEETELCAVVSALRSPPPADKTLTQVHEHILSMAQMLRGAIDLVKAHGSLEAALTVKSNTHAARLIELFVRKRPGDIAVAAIKCFEDMKSQFETDGAALAPYLELHGARTVESIAQIVNERPNLFLQHFRSAGSFVQKLREARYAARHLPSLLRRLRAILPAPLVDEIIGGPIEEEAVRRVETSGISDDRAKAAEKLRQLRDLFASTGFGDLFAAPADFSERQRASITPVTQTALRHAPEVLDLLIEATASSATANHLKLHEWPVAVARARTQHELKEIASREESFDVLVADDADDFDAAMLDQFAAAGTRVHRIGAAGADAIVLEVPHRQVNFEVADLASQRPGYWLAGPGGLGVLVREAADSQLDFLRSQLAKLVKALHDDGYSATMAPVTKNAIADIIVAAVDKLQDEDIRKLAGSAREGIVVLCRSDARRLQPALERPLSADAITAQSLGWRITRACTEGVQLEKDGKTVALVDEPVAFTGSEDLVTDIVDRLSSLGWRPIVAWRDAPRDPHDLQRLLESRSLPLAGEKPVRAVFERLDLSPPGLHGQDSLRAEEVSANPSAGPISSSLLVSEPAQPPPPGGVAMTRQAAEVASSSDQPTVKRAAPGPRRSEAMSVNPPVSAAVSASVTPSRLPAAGERVAESRELQIELAAVPTPAGGHGPRQQLTAGLRGSESPTITRSNPTVAPRFVAGVPSAAAKAAYVITTPDKQPDRPNVNVAVLTKTNPEAPAEPAVARPIAAISLLVQAMSATNKPSR